jgi:LuxR family maltose regulon positive regulatory protein
MFEIIREGIFKQLANIPATNLILIQAPAGSGKSTLLRQFRERLTQDKHRQIVAHPSIEMDELALVRDLLHGIGVSGPNADLGPLYHGDAIETLTDRFIQALLSLTGHTYVIVDDFHRYNSPSAVKFIANLAHYEPQLPVTIVVASRGATDVPVSALRLRGTLVEIGQEDLKFSEFEATALREMVDSKLDQTIWTAFWKKVDGWAVALQLALILLREQKLGIYDLMKFSGTQREMASYLSQQIVDSISEQDRALLYTAAAFDSLRPDIVAAALGHERATHLLSMIATLALPTEFANKQSEDIRLHGVVLEFFNARAQIERIDFSSLQTKAAKFLEERGEIRKAISYALFTKDIALAASIAERGGGWRLVYRGDEGTPRQFNDLSKMSPELFRSYPRTVLGLSVSAAKRGEIDLAVDLLEKIAAVADPADMTFAAELRLISALMDLYCDRQSTPEAVVQLENDIANDFDVDAVRLALTQNLLCYCSLQTADFKAAIHFGRVSLATFHNARSDFGAAHLPLHIGQAEFLGGQIENARATLQQHSEHCQRELGPTADLTLMTQALLNETMIEQSTSPTDRAFLHEAFIQLGRRDCWFDPLASLLVSQIRLALVEDDSTQAEAVLSQAEDVAHRRQYQRLAGLVEHLRIEVLLWTGQLKEAGQLFALTATKKVGNPAYDPVNLRGSPLAALQAGLLLANGMPEQALNLLDQLVERHDTARNVPRKIRLTLQKIRVLVALGDTITADLELDRLALSYRIDLYRLPFVEEGPVLARFVSEYSENHDPHSLIHRRLAPALELIAKQHPGAKTAISELVQLTDTETLVITLLAQGMTNKEIAQNLTVTGNTIKYHLANIYRKLGANTRTSAIARARESGLLLAASSRSLRPNSGS